MSPERARAHRKFRPTLEGRLESRELLSRVGPFQRFPAVANAPRFNAHRGAVHQRVAAGGSAVEVLDNDGERYLIAATAGAIVHAVPLPGGRVGLIVYGSTVDTELTISPVIKQVGVGHAHDYAVGKAFGDKLLHVGGVSVLSGQIGSILGYRTADLSGPIVVPGGASVKRIAFAAIHPGAVIATGGDLDTLDVLYGAQFAGTPGVIVGRDLNVVNVGQDLVFADGAALAVGRDIGLVPQVPELGSTGLGGRGGLIGGDLVIGPQSAILVGRNIVAFPTVLGEIVGRERIFVGGVPVVG